jgi:anti-sigma-K factor RskA
MDLDKFRSQWNDPEFEQSFARLDQEPPSAIVARLQSMDRRAKRWRRTCQIIMRASLLVLLVLAVVRLFVTQTREAPLQTVAFMLEVAVICVLQLLDKAREKYELPKLWLDHKEFLLDEHRRMDRNIRLDQWVSALLCVAIICLALYAAPFLSAGLQVACLAVTGAAVFVLHLVDRRKISQLKRSRDGLAAQLGDLPRE